MMTEEIMSQVEFEHKQGNFFEVRWFWGPRLDCWSNFHVFHYYSLFYPKIIMNWHA